MTVIKKDARGNLDQSAFYDATRPDTSSNLRVGRGSYVSGQRQVCGWAGAETWLGTDDLSL